jgi:hypothetical protein
MMIMIGQDSRVYSPPLLSPDERWFLMIIFAVVKDKTLLLTFTLPLVPAAAAQVSTSEKTEAKNDVDSVKKSASGIEDLFGDASASTTTILQPQKDVKSDIMSLFEKVCTLAFVGADA